jgi:excisionase family DNA binding protein
MVEKERLAIVSRALRQTAKQRQGVPSPVMTTREVADVLRVHTSTVYRLTRERKIPFFKIGSDFRFNRDEIDKWISDQSMVQHRSKSLASNIGRSDRT